MVVHPGTPFAQPGQWQKGQLHVHSTASDGERTPDEMVGWYRARGHRFLALVDVDVGSSPDVAACRKALPDAVFRLRLNPARLRSQTPDQVRVDVAAVLKQAGPLDKLALCCVAMDARTPDENVRALFETAESHHRRGA
jgi:hypothetical protein